MNTPIKYGHIVNAIASVFIAWLIIHLFFSIFQFKNDYYTIKCQDELYGLIGATSTINVLKCVRSDGSEFYANK